MKAVANILDGKVFSNLTVLRREENDMWGAAQWRVRCICGTEKTVRGSPLSNGRIKSCGCKARGRRMPKGNKGKFVRYG